MGRKDSGNNPTLLTSTLIIALCVVFGANSVAVKLSLAGLGPLFTAGIRFGIGGILIVLWMLFKKRSMHIKKSQFIPVIIVSMIFTVQIPLFNVGLNITTVSRAILIMNVQPFFVLILAHFFIEGDQINLRKACGILFGFIGIIFVFFEKQGAIYEFRTGDIVILISAALWACNAVYSKKIIDNFDSMLLAMYPMIFSTPLLLIGSYFWDEYTVKYVDSTIIVSMIYQITLSASIGFVLWMAMVKKYGAVSLNTFVFIMPVSGVLLGGLILGEALTYKILLAMLFVTLGLIITNFHSRQRYLKT